MRTATGQEYCRDELAFGMKVLAYRCTFNYRREVSVKKTRPRDFEDLHAHALRRDPSMAQPHLSISVLTTHRGDVGIIIWTDEDDQGATARTSRR